MARPLRVEYEGAFYHVTSRGNERGKIFFSDGDYEKFLSYLRDAKEKYGFVLHGYVLMTNHYHLLMETPEANLSKVMHYLNGAYTTYINVKRKRNGHLFQGRYKSIIIDRDGYLGELTRHIHLNPVRAGIVLKPEEYPYSSYRAYMKQQKDDLVSTEVVLQLVGGGEDKAQRRYRAFVEAGIGRELENPTKDVYGGMILGGTQFVKETLRKLKDEYLGKTEISHRRTLKSAEMSDEIMEKVARRYQISTEEILEGSHREARKVAVYLLKKHTGMANRTIGERFRGLGYSAVTKIHRRLEEAMRKNRRLRSLVSSVEQDMSHVKG
jgi:REP-associated tyrosine transposase